MPTPAQLMRDYQNSVFQLMKLASGNSEGSRVAAKVLLNCNDAIKADLRISDLGSLDSDFCEHAINVIRGRVQLRTCPEKLIANGQQAMQQLGEKWLAWH